MKAAEDYNTWIKVCLNNFKVCYLNKNLGFTNITKAEDQEKYE